MVGSRGGGGGEPPLPPLKNHKAIEFLNNTGLGTLENLKALSCKICFSKVKDF